MDTRIYIIFKDGFPHELLRGDYEFRMSQLEGWQSMFPEFSFSISDVGLELFDQNEY